MRPPKADGPGLAVLANVENNPRLAQKGLEPIPITLRRPRLSGNQSRWCRFPWGLPCRARQ